MAALMAELVSADRIRQVEVGGKAYGICRNFGKYQRPKNPSYRYPFSPAWGEYIDMKVGDSDSPTTALPQEYPSTPEKPLLMEDGGGKMEEEKKEPAPAALDREFDQFWEVYPKKVDRGHALKAFIAARKRNTTLETILAGAERYRDKPDRDPKYTKNAQGWLTGECWNDQAAEPPPEKFTSDEARQATLHVVYASMIKKGMSPGLKFSAIDRNQMIAAGLVTREDCEKAGCAA
jgi:hypothetical protein